MHDTCPESLTTSIPCEWLQSSVLPITLVGRAKVVHGTAVVGANAADTAATPSAIFMLRTFGAILMVAEKQMGSGMANRGAA